MFLDILYSLYYFKIYPHATLIQLNIVWYKSIKHSHNFGIKHDFNDVKYSKYFYISCGFLIYECLPMYVNLAQKAFYTYCNEIWKKGQIFPFLGYEHHKPQPNLCFAQYPPQHMTCNNQMHFTHLYSSSYYAFDYFMMRRVSKPIYTCK